MKTMQGEACFACSNRSRTREAPTPTNISTKSEPEIEKNGTPASPATARASSVLPVPGGPKGSSEVRIDHHGEPPEPFESNSTFFCCSSFWKSSCEASLG